MPKGRLPEATKQAIADEIAKETPYKKIAETYKVGKATISRIAKAYNLQEHVERSQTKKATLARKEDLKSMRAEIAQLMLEKAMALVQQVDQPYLVFNFGGKENTYSEELLDAPPSADIRNLMVAAATAIDKTIVIDRHDNGDSQADQAKAMLGQLGDMIFSNAVPRPKVSDESSAD